ncbi:MAG: Oligopeptide transport system permease protein OppC [Pseudomonadota bacterium]|jgi:peptide/nickel transport system permease protein
MTHSEGLWRLAFRRFRSDRVGMASAIIVAFSLVIVLLTALELLASKWDESVAVGHAPPSFTAEGRPLLGQTYKPEYVLPEGEPTVTEIADPIAEELAAAKATLGDREQQTTVERALTLPLGADKWGRDIVSKTIKGAETSILVGLTAALLATVIGTALGAVTGWFGGKIDDLGNWFYNVFTAIPGILLILAIAAVLGGRGLLSVVIILGLTGWTGVYRLVRAEYLKHRDREYVRGAQAIGASSMRRMLVHILPNVSHLVLVQFSLLTVACIKAEVILSFLGLGVPVDGVSWGTMLNEAQNDLILGKWWQLVSATLAMGIFVTALSMLTDSIRDALDPRLTHD